MAFHKQFTRTQETQETNNTPRIMIIIIIKGDVRLEFFTMVMGWWAWLACHHAYIFLKLLLCRQWMRCECILGKVSTQKQWNSFHRFIIMNLTLRSLWYLRWHDEAYIVAKSNFCTRRHHTNIRPMQYIFVGLRRDSLCERIRNNVANCQTRRQYALCGHATLWAVTKL